MLDLNLFINLHELGKHYCLNRSKRNSSILNAYLKMIDTESTGKMYTSFIDNDYILMTFAKDREDYIVEKLEAINTMIIIMPDISFDKMSNHKLITYANDLINDIVCESSRVIFEDKSCFDYFCKEILIADLVYEFFNNQYDDAMLLKSYLGKLPEYIPQDILTKDSIMEKISKTKSFNYLDFMDYGEEYDMYIKYLKKKSESNDGNGDILLL
jgi:hypothetical protein